MSFDEAIADLSHKIATQKDSIQTEEATKNAFIMPFISRVLGYDVFNPLEVVPEFTADHGTKKGEKVDYAIMKDSEVQILIECKPVGSNLNPKHASQLFRYFSVTNARIGILTNGRVFNFYTDLDSPNIMDDRPFLVLDLLEVDETLLPELRKLTKESFNIESVVSSAEELKYVGAIKREVAAEFKEPSTDFVKLFLSRVSERRATADTVRQFTTLTEKALRQYLKEQVNARLKTALGESYGSMGTDSEPDDPQVETEGADEVEVTPEADDGIVTTEEEIAGYQVVKAIACSEVAPNRITHRDAKSYFAILLDDNNRRTIARLRFNGKTKKYLCLLDEDKNETKYALSGMDDIYEHADALREAVRRLTE